MLEDKDSKLAIARDYYNQIVSKDLFSVDSINRSTLRMEALMRSYARNISTLAKKIHLV